MTISLTANTRTQNKKKPKKKTGDIKGAFSVVAREKLLPLVRHLKHKLFSPMNVFALVVNGSKHPIGIAEMEVLTRAFKPAPVIAV